MANNVPKIDSVCLLEDESVMDLTGRLAFFEAIGRVAFACAKRVSARCNPQSDWKSVYTLSDGGGCVFAGVVYTIAYNLADSELNHPEDGIYETTLKSHCFLTAAEKVAPAVYKASIRLTLTNPTWRFTPIGKHYQDWFTGDRGRCAARLELRDVRFFAPPPAPEVSLMERALSKVHRIWRRMEDEWGRAIDDARERDAHQVVTVHPLLQ